MFATLLLASLALMAIFTFLIGLALLILHMISTKQFFLAHSFSMNRAGCLTTGMTISQSMVTCPLMIFVCYSHDVVVMKAWLSIAAF